MIRPFYAEDLDACMALWLAGNLQAHNFIPAAHWQGAAAAVRGMLPRAALWVDEDGGTVRGFIGLQDDYIAGLFVAEPSQGHGVGGGLLAFCQQKYGALSLAVYEKNRRALRFYQAHGFQITEKHTEKDTGEASFRMTWRAEKKEEIAHV